MSDGMFDAAQGNFPPNTLRNTELEEKNKAQASRFERVSMSHFEADGAINLIEQALKDPGRAGKAH